MDHASVRDVLEAGTKEHFFLFYPQYHHVLFMYSFTFPFSTPDVHRLAESPGFRCSVSSSLWNLLQILPPHLVWSLVLFHVESLVLLGYVSHDGFLMVSAGDSHLVLLMYPRVSLIRPLVFLSGSIIVSDHVSFRNRMVCFSTEVLCTLS